MDKQENKRDDKKTRILKQGCWGDKRGKTPEIAKKIMF